MDSACSVSHHCRNIDRCTECLAFFEDEDEVLSREMPLLYVPITGSPREHPLAERRKRQRKRKLQEASTARQSAPVKHRRQLNSVAARNEVNTRNVILRATHRSGATNGDGDSRFVDPSTGEMLSIGIEDKLRSKSFTQFTASVAEINKAWKQKHCIVVYTLATGEKFAVVRLTDLTAYASELAQVLGGPLG